MKNLFIIILSLTIVPLAIAAEQLPIEIHHQLIMQPGETNKVALTLDACSGKYDKDLIDFLIQNHIPATLFVTKKWLDKNPAGTSVIKSHLDLFDVENHGEKHIPAVIGAEKVIYGIHGEPDITHLRREVTEGARAIEETIGVAPHWYRDATAEYDSKSIEEIGKLGYKIAGFSVNADNGATLNMASIASRLKHIKDGDIIIAHMNKPSSESAKGLSLGLTHLLKEGFVFVRLDQSNLR